MGYSTALFARGEMIAQGTRLPLHLGSLPEVVRACCARTAAPS
jgi:hypothetical protein